MATIMASTCLLPDEAESELIFDGFIESFIRIMTGFLDIWKSWSAAVFHGNDLSKTASATDDLEAIFQNFKEVSGMNTILEASLLELLEKYSKINCTRNGFTVEMGYIPPVYYTAIKCRVPQIRRQAVRVLRAAPHREGLWNGSLLADIVEEIIKVEEGDFYAGDVCVNSSVGYILPRDEDLLVPKVPAEARVSDVRVLLPDYVEGHTYVTYRRRVGGEWVTFKQKIGT